MSELQALALTMMVSPGVVTPTSLANDKTVVGMSPVGANPNSVPDPFAGGGD
jgi:hypothetical protein